MKNRFYLACFRDNVGGNVAFHGVKGTSYVTDVNKAKTLSREEAQRAWDMGREFDMPISADHVDLLTTWKVDIQTIPRETVIDTGVSEWVAYQEGRYNGNDVYWLTDKLPSLDFSQAKTFALSDISVDDEYIVYIPRALAETAKRQTFAMRDFNKRKMVQGAGLITPHHIKKEKRRKLNPKTRINCPDCGKLHWQYNPHDFEGCNDVSCTSHNSWL